MPTADQVKEFLKPLVEAFNSTEKGESSAMIVERFRQSVRASPEVAVDAALTCVYSDKVGGSGGLLVAEALATAYELEFQDDSLTKAVERTIKEAGLDEPETTRPPEAGDPVDQERRLREDSITNITIDAESLGRQDVYGLVKFFAYGATEPRARGLLAARRGRFVLTFSAVDEDPRPAWRIPEVRAYVAAIARAMPYFPYYLFPDPRLRQWLLYVGSLADPEAWIREFDLNLSQKSVLEATVDTLHQVAWLAEQLGDDPAEVCRDVLRALPDEMRSAILVSMGMEVRSA